MLDWTTDIQLCYSSIISLVADDTGLSLSTDNLISFETNPTLKDEVTGLVSPVLKIDRSQTIYRHIFIKGENWYGTVSDVVKIRVTVCGDEAVSNEDPARPVFNIHEIGTPLLLQDNWVSFDLSDLYSTASALLPTNECPLTQYQVCVDASCNSLYNSNSLRVIGVDEFQVNLLTPISPKTVYLKPISISGNFIIEPISIQVCGYETVVVTNQTPYT